MSHTQTTRPDDDLAPDLSDEDRAKARAGERAAMLQRLADIGMDMAEALAEELGERRRAKADEQAGERVSVADLSLAYNRVARAVRQTLALEARLEEGPLTRRPANDHADNNGFYPGSPKWAEWSAIQAKKIRAKIMTVALARTPEQRAAEDEAEYRHHEEHPADGPRAQPLHEELDHGHYHQDRRRDIDVRQLEGRVKGDDRQEVEQHLHGDAAGYANERPRIVADCGATPQEPRP